MARSKSSSRWLKEHFRDAYVKRARHEGYRSRAVYKLQEIQERDHILRPGMTVVDLGAAPGGWSQYAARIVGETGRLIAADVLPMEALPGVTVLQGDFRDEHMLNQLLEMLGGNRVDLVMSDMAPNISGVDAIDQPRAMYLAELALAFAKNVLAPGGDLLVKVFQGEGHEAYVKELRNVFGKVVLRKPRPSRSRSREMYALARNFNM